MKRIFTLAVLLLAFGVTYAQTTEDYAVELSADVSETPLQITLKWKPRSTDPPSYIISKKAKTATSWGTPIATLTASDTSYVDAAVIRDSGYEYQVLATGATFVSSGYIFAGVRNPAIHNRGTMLLIVDSLFSDSCSAQLDTLMEDLSGDGWQLIRHNFLRTTSDTVIKNTIAADYAAHTNVKSILIVGHIAVPYSGDQNPDGHPDHLGAWPADVYYANITGPWTDVTVNDVSAGYTANQNIPGDGKWDQVDIPSPVQLQIGRIDFNNMPAFGSTEVQMMKRYLAKDHAYKMDLLAVRHRALISDNFGVFSGEAFAQNGWRNFAPLVSKDSVSAISFISSLAGSSYQWAYGCGGGSFTSAGGIGNTSDFAANPNNGIFHMIFGSYFGDWNVQDNFLRAPLCANPPALTNCWAGRPNWFFHHMTLGENIGYGAMLTQNNTGALYQPSNYGATMVHVALMGDVSLRTDYIQQPTSLVVTSTFHAGATLTWAVSPDPAVIGYYVYRADSVYGYYQKMSGMLTTTTFNDVIGISGMKHYMVRPVKLTSTPSGRYYNLGVGITDSAAISFAPLQAEEQIVPGITLSLFPNPAGTNLNVTVNTGAPSVVTMYVINDVGQMFHTVTKQLSAGDNHYVLNVANMVPGVYNLVVNTGSNTIVKRFVKI